MGSTTKETKKSKRERTKYTPEQLELLERVFATTHYPDSVAMDDLADELAISNEKVSIWFQNRRSKFKRQSKDSQVTWMRNQVYNQENRPSLLTIPRGPEMSRFPVPNVTMDKNRHALSTVPTKTVANPDNKKPSSNLHYKPTSNPVTPTPLPWELNFRYTTPSPPYDLPSCAREILKDSNVSPAIARTDFASEQYYDRTSPANFWTNYSVTPTSGMVNIRPTSVIPQYPIFPPLDLTIQQFTAL